MADVSDTQPVPPPEDWQQPKKKKAAPKSTFQIPWGLFVLLGFYALAVLGYIWATYWRTPEYQAAEEIEAAKQILGTDDGEHLDQKKMEEAYSHFLEAARLTPKDRRLHERLQQIRNRMDERHMTLSRELVFRSEALAMLLTRSENEAAPLIVVGARDRGWTPEIVLAAPKTIVLWSIPGGVLISIFFFFRVYTERRLRGDDHEAESKRREQELIDLERARTIGSVNEDGTFKEREGGDILMQGREKKKKPAPTGAPRASKPGLAPRPKKKP